MSCPGCPPAVGPGEIEFYVAINFQNVIYGAVASLYISAMFLFFQRRKHAHRFDPIYAVFSSILFVVATVSIAVVALRGERMWLFHRNYPGGPFAYDQAHLRAGINLVSGITTVIIQQMAIGFMIHRNRLVWGSYLVIILPCILWLAVLVLGILVVWASRLPHNDVLVGLEGRLSLAYYTIAVFAVLGVSCTLFSRVLWHGKRVRKTLGAERASLYFSVANLTIESMLPIAVAAILFAIPLWAGFHLELFFSRIYVLTMCLAPQIVILQFARGKSWDEKAFKVPETAIVLPPPESPVSGSSGESRPWEAKDREKATVKFA